MNYTLDRLEELKKEKCNNNNIDTIISLMQEIAYIIAQDYKDYTLVDNYFSDGVYYINAEELQGLEKDNLKMEVDNSNAYWFIHFECENKIINESVKNLREVKKEFLAKAIKVMEDDLKTYARRLERLKA